MQQKALVLAQRGEGSGAIDRLSQAVYEAPDRLALHLDRAGLLIDNGRDVEASADTELILATRSASALGHYYKAVLASRRGKFDLANAELDRLSLFVSCFPDAYFPLAVVKRQVGQQEAALDAALRYAARQPDGLRGTLLIAHLLLGTGQPGRALQLLTPPVDKPDNAIVVLDLRGVAYAALGHSSEALNGFGRA